MNIKSKYLYLLTAIMAMLFGFAIWRILANNSTGVVALTVIPSDAKVVVDNKTTTKPSTIRLPTGKHTFKVSRNGFITVNFSVTVIAKQTQTKQYALASDGSGIAKQYAQANPNEVRQGEGITGSNANTIGQSTTANNPLIALLPYVGGDFRVDFGQSAQHPNDPNYVAIYISPDNNDGKQHALDWIKAQGFDPAAYEIIYNQTYDN